MAFWHCSLRTATAARDGSQGGGKRKSTWTFQVFHFRSGYFQAEGKRACVCVKERESKRTGEGERDAKGDGEREEMQRDSDRGLVWWHAGNKALLG